MHFNHRAIAIKINSNFMNLLEGLFFSTNKPKDTVFYPTFLFPILHFYSYYFLSSQCQWTVNYGGQEKCVINLRYIHIHAAYLLKYKILCLVYSFTLFICHKSFECDRKAK